MDEKLIPLMGVLEAFIFAGQMINFTIPGTGSSGHIGGGMLLAILLGPYAAFIVIASVLVVQALFFADGGLLALGANIWNLGIYPAFIGYPLIYRAITKNNASNKAVTIATILSVVIGLQLGALSVVLETKLSGISELPLSTFFLMMQPIHLAIGLVEGIATAGIVIYVRSLRPDIVDNLEGVKIVTSGGSLNKLLIVMSILAVITGGAFSWFASTNPDGLEWSIEKIYGKPEVPEKQDPLSENLAKLQEKTAIRSSSLLARNTLPLKCRKHKPRSCSEPRTIPFLLIAGFQPSNSSRSPKQLRKSCMERYTFSRWHPPMRMNLPPY